MANSIALANKFLPKQDEVYKVFSKSAGLDAANADIKFIGANEVKVFKMALQGLGNYGRDTGYVDGDVTGTWETLTLPYDRARSFQVDAMDDEESLGLAFGRLVSTFMKTKVIPEIDTVRFAKYAIEAGNKVNADLSTAATVLAAIDTAEKTLDDAEVPEEGRKLYVSNAVYQLLKGGITRMFKNEGTVNRNVEYFDEMEVVKVPAPRFNVDTAQTTAGVALYDGSTTGQTAGGFFFDKTSSYGINFLIVHPSAVVQTIKHEVPRIFSPQENQKANAWRYDYRLYHGVNVLDNKVNGIYLHRRATANTADIAG